MATILEPRHGEVFFEAGEAAKLLIPENLERVAGVIQNNSAHEFRLVIGDGPPPSETHGFVLRPGKHVPIANFIGYSGGGMQPLFTGNVTAIAVKGGGGQLDFVEILAVTGEG